MKKVFLIILLLACKNSLNGVKNKMDRTNSFKKRPSSYHAGYGEEGVKKINEKQLIIAENEKEESARRFFLSTFIEQNTFGTAKDGSVVTIRKMAEEYNCKNVIKALDEIEKK